MEEDDEFGDLYTDVLRPLQSSSAPVQSSSAPQPPRAQYEQPSSSRPIGLKVQSEDDEILDGAPNSSPEFNLASSLQDQTVLFKSEKAAPKPGPAGSSDSRWKLNLAGQQEDQGEGFAEGVSNRASDLPKPSASRVSESGGDVKLQGRGFEDPNSVDESGIDVVVEKNDDEDDVLVEKDKDLMDKIENFEKFDIEEVDTEIGEIASEPVIPGLSITRDSDAADNRGDGKFIMRDEVGGEGDDWDSDSEDDLQIVLNDNNHGPMVMDGTGVMGSDDEDGDPLVILGDSEPGHQPMEEQEWAEDATQAADGERKDSGNAAKVNGGVAVAPKIGYSSHPYHPYHSQFKYVRPGAAPMPGAAAVGPGGVPSQVRPPVNMVPIAGRGRGDWRPTGIKGASPMQRGFHPGYGPPAWGSNASGRGIGLEFTLPSHKTIFEVDVDSFEEKPWKLPGIDISDFFNFGLNEESWKDYCKHMEQFRMEATMQSKIHVYESGRTDQEHDPDMPPELAAAAGIHEISPENANLGKMEAGPNDTVKGTARVRPPLPTGRAIQVETGSGERLPSIDTRPPRIRDSDAIIEIVLQDSRDDDSIPVNDGLEKTENDTLREDSRASHEIGGDSVQEDIERFDDFPHAHIGRNRELVGRQSPFANSIRENLTERDQNLPSSLEAPVQYSPDSRGQACADPERDVGTLREERMTKGRVSEKSPDMTHSESTLDKGVLGNQKEDSVESIGRKHSPHLSSPVTVRSAEERDVERGEGLYDDPDGSSGNDRDERALDATETCMDENPFPSVKKQKLSSRVEQSSLQEIDDGGDSKATRSSENSKARSGSSRDYRKLRDSADEEVVQHERSRHMGSIKRPHSEEAQHVRRRSRDGRPEIEKHHLVEKGREDSYSRRDWDSRLAHRSHGKIEGIDRRKERESSEGAWQRRAGDPHGRRTRVEDTRKQDRADELGSKRRNKVRESEWTDKDEHHQLRKQLDNGHSRGYHDKDVGSQYRERDDNSKSRCENMVDLHSKRRKEDELLRRDAGKEEVLHGHRENSTSRKRDRDTALDLRKRDDQMRSRDDDHHSVRHKEEGWIHRERQRDEWQRIKSHEDSSSKREREEGRGGARSGRAAEDKAWISHGRVKDKGSDRDYQFRDTGRHGEQLKRRDRVEDGSFLQHRGREDVHARGNQLSNDERRLRQERATTRSDRAVSGSDNNRVLDRKQKENTRKSKEYNGGDQNFTGPSKRNQDLQSGQTNELVISKGTSEQGNTEHEILLNRHSSKKRREDASSDDEQQDSRRGRSKLERWTSHKERDFSIGSKSSSLKVKQIDKNNNGGSSLASKLPEKTTETIDNHRPSKLPEKTTETIDNHRPSSDREDAGDSEEKNLDGKPLENKHLDTVAKLKKRSERFKLPMPSEKDAMAIKKIENEPLPSAQSEPRADSAIKPERPARKRRWIGN